MVLDSVIHEAYVGKTKNILEIEHQIEVLRKKYGNGIISKMFTNLGSAIDKSPELKKISELFCEQFGFYSCSIFIMNDPLPNACTMPLTYRIDGTFIAKNNLLVSNKFIKYDKSAKFCLLMGITIGLLFSKQLTAAEITGILLHEIGHNFDTAIFIYRSPIHCLRSMLNIILQGAVGNVVGAALSLATVTNPTARMTKKVYEEFRDTPFGSFFIGLVSLICFFPARFISFLIVKNIMPYINALVPGGGIGLNMIQNPAALMVLPINFAIANVDTYHSETFSDSFAALFGYGPELSSGLSKLEDMVYIDEDVPKEQQLHRILSMVPIFGHMIGLNLFVSEVFNSLFDGHPEVSTRMKTSLLMLEKDLDDPRIDSKTKAAVKQDIKEIKDLYEKVNNIKDSDKEHDNYAKRTKGQLLMLLGKLSGKYPDFRSYLKDKFFGGAQGIHDTIENMKK